MKPNNILRADRILRVLRLMRQYGPSRFAVDLDARALDVFARDIIDESQSR